MTTVDFSTPEGVRYLKELQAQRKIKVSPVAVQAKVTIRNATQEDIAAGLREAYRQQHQLQLRICSVCGKEFAVKKRDKFTTECSKRCQTKKRDAEYYQEYLQIIKTYNFLLVENERLETEIKKLRVELHNALTP